MGICGSSYSAADLSVFGSFKVVLAVVWLDLDTDPDVDAEEVLDTCTDTDADAEGVDSEDGAG